MYNDYSKQGLLDQISIPATGLLVYLVRTEYTSSHKKFDLMMYLI